MELGQTQAWNSPAVGGHANKSHLSWCSHKGTSRTCSHANQGLQQKARRCAISPSQALKQHRVDAKAGSGVGGLAQQASRQPGGESISASGQGLELPTLPLPPTLYPVAPVPSVNAP